MQNQANTNPPAKPILEPNTKAFLDALAAKGGPQIYELMVPEARGVLISAQADPVAKLPADMEDLTIPGGPSGQISLRIVRPQGKTGVLPVVMYFHCGGWVLGDHTTHDRLVRELAHGAEAVGVFVNFTPSPEARYPVAVEEAFAATQWIAANGAELQLDGERVAVARSESLGRQVRKCRRGATRIAPSGRLQWRGSTREILSRGGS